MRTLAAVAAVPLTLVAGGWLLGAVAAPGYRSAIVLIAGWFVVVSAVAGRLGRRHGLRGPLRATMAACVAVTLALGWWTSVRETTVDEPLVTGTPASQLPAPAVDPLAPLP